MDTKNSGLGSEDLYEGLVRHGHIVPVGVQGAFGRGAVFEDVLDRFNQLVSRISVNDGAHYMVFPPIINRALIEKLNYMDSFPHLCGAVCSFFGTEKEAKGFGERVREGKPWNDLLGMTGVVLNPAACYPVYPSFTGTCPGEGHLVTMLNWVYRHEPSPEPTRMQSFRVREFVRVGTADQVVQWRDMWLKRGLTVLLDLGLDARSDVASDPFFGRAGKMLAASQAQQQLKFEVLVPVNSVESPTAVCSFNFHQQYFGTAFDIKLGNGETASTACLGFGLERIVMALFRTHGFDVEKWPSAVRRQLWP